MANFANCCCWMYPARIKLNPMQILTLTTDWHRDDYYAGLLHGLLLQVAPDVRIVPISQHIAHHNTIHAAFVLRMAHVGFAPGTIHLCLVGSETCKSRQMLVFEHNKHWFIVPDNGMAGMLFDDEPPTPPRAFAMADGAFGALRATIMAFEAIVSNSLEQHPTADNYLIYTNSEPSFSPNSITGKIVYIDSYGNAISNISRQLFEMVGKGRAFSIPILPNVAIRTLSKSYHEGDEGDLIALFNSAGLLEFAIKAASLSTMYGKKVDDSIMVQFDDEQFSLFTP